MFGIRYMKAPPTSYVLHFVGGQAVREGAGLSFFYWAPSAVIVSVPIGSVDVPFVFNEVTADFQDATIQGELTYRITDPRRVAALLDYSLDARGHYRSDDPTKLSDRLVHAAQILARSFTQRHELKELLVSSDALVAEVLAGLKTAEGVTMLGVEVLGLSILSIKATPEMSKALQAAAREQLLRQADEAIYARRNTAVELERTIKENELNTEIAVEQKKRQVVESQWDAQIAAEQKKRQVSETKMAADVAVEEQRSVLVERRVANDRQEADARAYALRAVMEPIKDVDWRTLMATNAGSDPRFLISLAFQELAANASRIGELNVSPELLHSLLKAREE
jgi:hypothetical protein